MKGKIGRVWWYKCTFDNKLETTFKVLDLRIAIYIAGRLEHPHKICFAKKNISDSCAINLYEERLWYYGTFYNELQAFFKDSYYRITWNDPLEIKHSVSNRTFT